MLEVSVTHSLREVSEEAWNALVGTSDPFVEHAFLSTLEASGSVGGESGWHPAHLLAQADGKLVGALPMYLKEHSYGEYIFDWGWASGAQRAGVPYYPKLVSMAPLTPATGERLLVHPEVSRAEVVSALLEGALRFGAELGVSSVHLLFLTEAEHDEAIAFEPKDGLPPFLSRLSMQYHWHAQGEKTFEEYLARFRASKRKGVRRERRKVRDAGLEVRIKEGHELTSEDWTNLYRFYEDTCAKKGSFPYLTKAFFELGATTLTERALAVFAYDGERCVAGTLNFEKGDHLYGRYWGCDEEYDMLHFELCYYALIERAIARGVRRFEAGAQGRQKLRRGLMPSAVYSAHAIFHEGLEAAVAAFLPDEAAQVRHVMAMEAKSSPFREDTGQVASAAESGATSEIGDEDHKTVPRGEDE